ncbi:Ovostatin [Symbiodinium sp. KB8]|nr:Ovostatin [Symbiodinium sp. KB8]
MAREIPLPHAWYQVALEESLLLDALRNLVPAERPQCIPPAASMASRNDIVVLARETLTPDEYEHFLLYADKLSQHLPMLAEDAFPTLPNHELEPPHSAAEHMARLYMAEKQGSLWAAVRDIVTALPFACQQRQLSDKPAMTFSAGAYGHRSYVGLHKQTSKTPMVCRMFNALIRQLAPALRWTTLSVVCNSLNELHIDRQNAAIDSLVLGLSHFTGGHLWLQDSTGTCFEEVQQNLLPGRVYEISRRCYLLPAFARWHRTYPWQDGDRIVLIAYAIGQYRCLSAEHKAQLQDLGFVLPGP